MAGLVKQVLKERVRAGSKLEVIIRSGCHVWMVHLVTLKMFNKVEIIPD